MAKEIKGAPKELIGYYGANADECRSYHRKGGENVTVIGRVEGYDYYGTCGGNDGNCSANVVTHRPIPSGFSLNLRYEWKSGYTENSSVAVTRVQKDIYKFQLQGGEPRTLMRCSRRDVLAGLGRPAEIDSSDTEYPYYYVLAVPNLCPELEVATERFPSGIYWQRFNDN